MGLWKEKKAIVDGISATEPGQLEMVAVLRGGCMAVL